MRSSQEGTKVKLHGYEFLGRKNSEAGKAEIRTRVDKMAALMKDQAESLLESSGEAAAADYLRALEHLDILIDIASSRVHDDQDRQRFVQAVKDAMQALEKSITVGKPDEVKERAVALAENPMSLAQEIRYLLARRFRGRVSWTE